MSANATLPGGYNMGERRWECGWPVGSWSHSTYSFTDTEYFLESTLFRFIHDGRIHHIARSYVIEGGETGKWAKRHN